MGVADPAPKSAPTGGYAAPKATPAPVDSGSSDWQVHLGPLSFGNKGVDLKPQLKVGVDSKNMNADFGLGDVRDGIRLSAKVEAKVDAKSEGRSVKQLHENIRCDTPGFSKALDIAKGALDAGGNGVATMACELGLDIKSLQKVLEGCHGCGSFYGTPMESEPATLNVKAALAVGASGHVCLGWENTSGFHMVGAGGQAAAAVSLGCNIFVGKHCTGTLVKIVLGIGNFDFEYVLPSDAELFRH